MTQSSEFDNMKARKDAVLAREKKAMVVEELKRLADWFDDGDDLILGRNSIETYGLVADILRKRIEELSGVSLEDTPTKDNAPKD